MPEEEKVIRVPAENAEAIARLNDEFRRTLTGGIVLITPGVESSPYKDRIIEAVRRYDFARADPGNDPYFERDFGALSVGGERYYFKIDYYDLRLEMHSPNPSDPKVTQRVLTLMHCSEY